MTANILREICCYIFSFVGGIAISIYFLTALWCSLSYSMNSRFPVCMFLLLGFVRVAVVMCAFMLFSSGDWVRLLVCAAGFAVGRRFGMLFRFNGKAKCLQIAKQVKESIHASDTR